MFSIIKRTFTTNRPTLFVFPICEDCKHYIKYTRDSLSKCKKIKIYNHNNDELEYEYADYIRRNRTICGYEGKAFESKYSKTFIEESKTKPVI
jgi:hypothetical protein